MQAASMHSENLPVAFIKKAPHRNYYFPLPHSDIQHIKTSMFSRKGLFFNFILFIVCFYVPMYSSFVVHRLNSREQRLINFEILKGIDENNFMAMLS